MAEETFHTSRRGILRRAAAAAAGAAALAVGLDRVALAAPDRPPPAAGGVAAATPQTASALTLLGRGWRMTGASHRTGRLPGDGDRGSVSGELADAVTGAAVGTFRSACFHGGRAASDLELHTFALEDGMLVGMGSTQGGEGTFAIIGGTGRFAGARGTYVARQGHREVGGDGGAEFAFTILS